MRKLSELICRSNVLPYSALGDICCTLQQGCCRVVVKSRFFSSTNPESNTLLSSNYKCYTSCKTLLLNKPLHWICDQVVWSEIWIDPLFFYIFNKLVPAGSNTAFTVPVTGCEIQYQHFKTYNNIWKSQNSIFYAH